MTTIFDLSARLPDLLASDLQCLGYQFAVIASMPDYPRAAALGEWWLWRIVRESNRRSGRPQPDQEPPCPDELSVAELLAIRDAFGGLAAAHPDEALLAGWCRAFVDFATLAILDPGEADGDQDEADSRATLLNYIAEMRARRPLGHRTPDASVQTWWPNQTGRTDGV